MLHENLARLWRPRKVLQSPRVITLKDLVFSTKMAVEVTGLPRSIRHGLPVLRARP